MGAIPKKLWPLPVNGLFSHPDYVALPTAGRGMLLSLCEHFWRTGCKPLPKDDDQLFAIARAHRPTWRHWKAPILKIFRDIEPELAGYYALRLAKGTTLSFASHKGQAKRRLQVVLDQATPAPPALSIPHKSDRGPINPPAPTTKRKVLTDRR